MKKILTPTDFSQGSVHALNYAAILGKKLMAEIVAIWVDNTSSMDIRGDIVINEIKKDAKINLDLQIEEVKKSFPNLKISAKIRSGKVYKEISNYAQTSNTDIIVLGTHGGSGYEDYWIGSNAYRIVSTAECPVISIRPNYKFSEKGITKILAPVDHTGETLNKIDTIIEFAKNFDAEVQILTLYATPLKTINRKADYATTFAYNKMKSEGITVYQDVITTTNITADILRFIYESDIDLLAIMTDQKSKDSQTMPGQEAQQLINQCSVPVLSIKGI